MYLKGYSGRTRVQGVLERGLNLHRNIPLKQLNSKTNKQKKDLSSYLIC